MNGLHITQDTQLEPRVYLLPDGLTIEADGVTLDGRGATLLGVDKAGQGIRAAGRRNITIRNLKILNFHHGIAIRDAQEVEISHCTVTSTAEAPANTLFLDVWKPAAEAYGGGLYLERVTQAWIHNNDLQHQMNGLLSYHCQHLDVTHNLANYCSGFGFHLFETSHSTFADNYADFCCRYHLREGGVHLGADAAGFLIVHGSCHNVFRGNFARLGGDGFFLAGLTPEGQDVGCNHNLFEANDASCSPNNAFEGVFSRGNIYRRNQAAHSNYGFWLGFSSDCRLEANQIRGNRQAGVAVENGVGFTVRENDIRENGHGILLWSRSYDFLKTVPEANPTSRDWLIEHNRLIGNRKGLRIAANQNHGVKPLAGEPARMPLGRHLIQNNEILDNVVGIELENVLDTKVDQNTTHNLVSDLVER